MTRIEKQKLTNKLNINLLLFNQYLLTRGKDNPNIKTPKNLIDFFMDITDVIEDLEKIRDTL